MRITEKIKAFRDAVAEALKKINEDRDLATDLLENAVLIRDKYRLCSELCKNTAEGLCTIRDQFDEAAESSSSSLSKTLTNTITVLRDWVTVKPVESSDSSNLVSYLFYYDTSQGASYTGISEIFYRLAYFIDVNISLMKEKMKKRNFSGAIRQYIVMRDIVKGRCEENGIKQPSFPRLNLDKYKNTEENDN